MGSARGFSSITTGNPKPVILLEGTRSLPKSKFDQLKSFARRLAERYPQANFRSGNAVGSDNAFAEGIASVCGAKLELILPHANVGRVSWPEAASIYVLEQIPVKALATYRKICSDASPSNRRLFELEAKPDGLAANTRLGAVARYLLRDAMKVLGCESLGLKPADTAFFYVNPSNPEGGGTGHTMRICRLTKVPYLTQDDWL